MHADELSKIVVQDLIDKGFKGIIPANQARQIVEEVTAKFKGSNFKITVDMSPIHNVGKATEVNCSRSSVKVEPKYQTPKNR